jgi:hypothetical protein
MTRAGRNMCTYTSDGEEILTFKTFKGFEKQVAYETVSSIHTCLAKNPPPISEAPTSDPIDQVRQESLIDQLRP